MKIQQIRFDKLNYSSPQVRKMGLPRGKAGKEYSIIDGNRRVMTPDELGTKKTGIW